MTELEVFHQYDDLIEVCDYLYEKLPIPKKRFQEGVLGFRFSHYEKLTKAFKEGLNAIIILCDEETVSKLFVRVADFYETFCPMKSIHWECDAPCTPQLAYCITRFSRFSSDVIRFLALKEQA